MDWKGGSMWEWGLYWEGCLGVYWKSLYCGGKLGERGLCWERFWALGGKYVLGGELGLWGRSDYEGYGIARGRPAMGNFFRQFLVVLCTLACALYVLNPAFFVSRSQNLCTLCVMHTCTLTLCITHSWPLHSTLHRKRNICACPKWKNAAEHYTFDTRHI